MFKAIATRETATLAPWSIRPLPAALPRRHVARKRARSIRGKDAHRAVVAGRAAPKLTRGDSPFINFRRYLRAPDGLATVEITFEAAQGQKTEFKNPRGANDVVSLKYAVNPEKRGVIINIEVEINPCCLE